MAFSWRRDRDKGREGNEVLAALRQAAESRVRLFTILATIAGFALIFLQQWIDSSLQQSSSFAVVPWAQIGGALVGSALALLAFDFYVRRQTQAISRLQMEEMLSEYETRASAAILDSLRVGDQQALEAYEPYLLTEELVKLSSNALGRAIGSPPIAEAGVRQILQRTRAAPDHWSDLRIRMSLRPDSAGSSHSAKYLDLYVQTEFLLVTRPTSVATVCTTDPSDYRQKLSSGDFLWCWYHEPTPEYPRATKDVFELESVWVNDTVASVRRSTAPSFVSYSADLAVIGESDKQSEMARVRMSIRMRIQRRGHCIYFDVPRTCESVRYDLDYAGCGFRFVNVIDAFGSPRSPVISRLPGAPERVTVEMNDWVYAKSGIVFVWVLEEEMSDAFLALGRGESD